jgi:hypothetical protein
MHTTRLMPKEFLGIQNVISEKYSGENSNQVCNYDLYVNACG